MKGSPAAIALSLWKSLWEECAWIAPGLCCLCVLLVACQQSTGDGITTITGHTMGTTYSVNVVDPPTPVSDDELSQGIQQTLDAIDKLMSTWRQDSELSRFNQAPVGEWIQLSTDTMAVLDLALATSRDTRGSFDVTVAPLVNLWGFGPREYQANSIVDAVPDDVQIQRAMLRVGYQHLLIDLDAQAAKKLADVTVDLSAIAKGYAVDKLAVYLESLGSHHYLVEVGGEVRGKGRKLEGGDWIIAIESPTPGERRAHITIALRGAALATSGDYRNYFENNSKRYSHTIDPTTGRPVSHSLASVTVVDKTAARADAYATALTVMGPDIGYRFAQENRLAAYFIVRQDGGFSERHTAQFDALLDNKAD